MRYIVQGARVFSILCFEACLAVKMTSDFQNSVADLPETSKAFQATSGSGWCVDSGGLEGTARKLTSVGCQGAQNVCESDDMCVAFACQNSSTAGARSVLYTTSDCKYNCERWDWVMDPSLVTNASTASSDSEQVREAWSQAQCYKQTAQTRLSGAAGAGSMSISVLSADAFAVGDSVRIYTEVKTITGVSSGIRNYPHPSPEGSRGPWEPLGDPRRLPRLLGSPSCGCGYLPFLRSRCKSKTGNCHSSAFFRDF